MSQQIQMRRDTDAARQAITLASGEPFWCTDTLEMYVGDGATPGGQRVYGQTGIRWEGGITGLTGGGATKLDGIATANVSAGGLLVLVRIAGDLGGWLLIAGSDAEDPDGGIVRPDDFDGVTNMKIFLKVL